MKHQKGPIGREIPNGRKSARRIAVIGAGPGGICTGIKLKEAGFDNFVILEKSGGVGGTWYHNRYPGAACDVRSHMYSFSFELNLEWSRPFATQAEIAAYMERCVEKYDLRPHIRFNTEVCAAHWDEECTVWRLITEKGEEIIADAVVAALGMFNELNWPDIPGRDEFEGTSFHSARWDHAHDLTGEKVGVIGSAASAVQFVPEIAKVAGQLHVFQRTPNWVLPKEDKPFTPEELERFRNDPMAAREYRWSIFRELEGFITFSDPEALKQSEELGLQNLAKVEDPEVRRKLTPDFPFGCKRPLISDNFYPTFNRANVELVTEGIDRITHNAIVTNDGTERRVDTIVFATGFAVDRYLSTIEVTGRNGVNINDAWAEGAQAYLGITTTGFPNLFMLYGPNTNNGSILFMIECQVGYILRQLQRMESEGIAWLDVRPDVMARYNQELQRDLDNVTVWQADCSNYYRGPSGRIVTQWPHTMREYRARTRRPDPEAFECEYGEPLTVA